MSQYVYASGRHALAGLSDDYFYGLSGPAAKSDAVKRAVEGEKYLVQNWVDQANIAEKEKVKFATPKAVKTKKGKASVKVTSFWADWNKSAARAIRPVAQVIKSIDLIPRALRNKLADRPLDFIIDLFDPLFNFVATPCTRTMNQHLKGGRRVEWFGKFIDIRISQPAIDNKLDKSTKNLMRKLRIIQAFIVCFIKKGLEFTGECLKAGVDLVSGVVKSVGKAVDSAVMSIGAATQAAGKAVGDLVQDAAEQAQKAVDGVASAIGGFFGFGDYRNENIGLGEPTTAVAGGAAAGTTAVAGVSIETIIAGVISSLITAVGSVVTVAITTGAQKEVELSAIKSGVKYQKKLPDGTVMSFEPGAAPRVTTASSVVDALADNERGPPTAPPPPDVRTLQAESAKTADADDDDDDDDGFPVLPVALAAGVVALLLLKR